MQKDIHNDRKFALISFRIKFHFYICCHFTVNPNTNDWFQLYTNLLHTILLFDFEMKPEENIDMIPAMVCNAQCIQIEFEKEEWSNCKWFLLGKWNDSWLFNLVANQMFQPKSKIVNKN